MQKSARLSTTSWQALLEKLVPVLRRGDQARPPGAGT